LIAGGWYAASLRPYARRFGDQLRVFLYDDAVADPIALYADVLRHIGVYDTSFVPRKIDRVRFSGRPPDTSPYAESGGRRSLSPEERRQLFPWFERDIAKLEKMIGRDLSAWRPE